MSTLRPSHHPSDHRIADQQPPLESQSRSHHWMMLACCLPMVVIAIALLATGTASPGFLLVAVVCTVMMALMMRGMDHAGRR
jgi:drug/metabolite transporter (DMT)-like permease